MFKKIKEYFETRKNYKNAKKLLVIRMANLLADNYDDYDNFKTTITVLNSKFYDLVVAETEAKEAEKKAYESMITFGDNFKVEDLNRLVTGIDTIANNPNLTTEYYKDVTKRANKEKVNESKIEVVK